VESPPTHTSNSSDSSTHALASGLQKLSSSLPTVNRTVFFSPGGKQGSLETFEFTSRPGGAARALMQIELDNFVPGTAAPILDIDGDLQRPTRRQRGRTELQIGEGKLL
jgi:hypothetical protein